MPRRKVRQRRHDGNVEITDVVSRDQRRLSAVIANELLQPGNAGGVKDRPVGP